MSAITIRDVLPRDGLQGERPLEPTQRARLAIALAEAGLTDIEAASFVSISAVPSMAGGAEVIASLPDLDGVAWWALVPNRRGAELAIDAGVTNLTVTISASEAYSRKNVGRTIAEAVAELSEIGRTITDPAGGDIEIDIVVSCAFGSPFDDVGDPSSTRAIVEHALDVMPAARITLADTTGTATPRRISEVILELPGSAHRDLGLHLHDTRGTALVNALAGINLGITRFDTCTGGLGGSPFAPGAGGNLATEDLVLMLHDLGYETGIELEAVLAISRSLEELIGHEVPSRVASAGGLPRFGS
jgi:hydroxymethylglutaryl-CoA lyase